MGKLESRPARCRKRSYQNLKDAIKHIELLKIKETENGERLEGKDYKRLRVYQCLICHSLHVGHIKKQTEPETKQTETTVNPIVKKARVFPRKTDPRKMSRFQKAKTGRLQTK